jgi:hypothetical protein
MFPVNPFDYRSLPIPTVKVLNVKFVIPFGKKVITLV